MTGATTEPTPETEESASFTIRYLLQDGTPVAPELKMTGRPVGEEMPARAKQFDGYRLVSDEIITITLQVGDENFITFYYEEIPEEDLIEEENPKEEPTAPPVIDPETPG